MSVFSGGFQRGNITIGPTLKVARSSVAKPPEDDMSVNEVLVALFRVCAMASGPFSEEAEGQYRGADIPPRQQY